MYLIPLTLKPLLTNFCVDFSTIINFITKTLRIIDKFRKIIFLKTHQQLIKCHHVTANNHRCCVRSQHTKSVLSADMSTNMQTLGTPEMESWSDLLRPSSNHRQAVSTMIGLRRKRSVQLSVSEQRSHVPYYKLNNCPGL